MISAAETIQTNWDRLLSPLEGDQRSRKGEALRRLRENLIRLKWRYDECRSASALPTAPPTPNYSGPNLDELQLRFVDKVEAFHQHIYATLAVLALVLNHSRTKESTQTYPVGSISKFLMALKDRNFRYKDRYLVQVGILERSADFRSKYIDHPERHQLHDWMTYKYVDRVHVIYFIKRSQTVSWLGGNPDPSSPDFRPPVGCGDDFYVSPDTERTYDAMQRVAIAALRLN
jgi:hypothetical protein